MASRVPRPRVPTLDIPSIAAIPAEVFAPAPGTRNEDIAYAACYGATVVLFLSLWHWMVLHALPPRAVAAYGLLTALSFAYGSVSLRRTALASAGHSSLTHEFLCGYLLVSTLLFVLDFASPLGLTANVLIVTAGGVAAALAGRVQTPPSTGSAAGPASLVAFALCAVATTLWCTDALTPLQRDGATTIFRLWGDSFVHARHISAFVHAHGLASMSDIRMWGAPPYLYHYATYAVPAVVSAMTQSGAYEVFASFLLPVGVLLTGLAAFALAGSLWGRWPAAVASFAILLIPDAYQQGFGNKYLSYDFMQQVNVGGLYGVACMAVAWIFVLHGCRSRNFASITIGWAAAFVTLPYKAHVFVASSFLIMIYPCLFLAGLQLRWRIAAAAALTACFVLAVTLSQTFDRIPTLRLDGSGARTYIAYLLANQDPGLMKSFIDTGLGSEPWAAPRLVLFGGMLVLLGTFGYWVIAAVATVLWVRKSVPAAVWAFPLLVIANYLAMALGLAMDGKQIGSPDELLNRPLVWAYFAVVAWTGGAIYHRLFGDGLPRATGTRAVLGSAAVLGLVVPLTLAANLQTFPHWSGFASFRELGGVPTCLVDAARFIRGHGSADDVVQDSENDPRVWVTALAERPDFAMDTPNRPPAGLDRRLADLAAFKRLTDAADIEAFATRNRIAWYLLRPTGDVAWPAKLQNDAVFECGGYRVFHFAPGRRRAAGD